MAEMQNSRRITRFAEVSTYTSPRIPHIRPLRPLQILVNLG